MEQKFCQSCGMPLTEEILGTNADGIKNEDHCIYCYMCILTILTPILMMLTPSKRAGLSKSSLCLRANRQQRSCKDITFSFS